MRFLTFGLIVMVGVVLNGNTVFADYNITSGAGLTILNAITGDPAEVGAVSQTQSFSSVGAGTASDMTICAVRANDSGNTDDLRVGIYADVGTGQNTGSELAGFDLNWADITTSGASYTRSFDVPFDLSASTNYVIVMSRPTFDATNYFADCGSGSSIYGIGGSYDVAGAWGTRTATVNFSMDVVESGGGGGEGFGGATSTVDQSQENLFSGFILFFITMFFTIWFFRKN